ncbi:MAG: hypothetical protein Q9170_002881 [Blastenia crenularia]
MDANGASLYSRFTALKGKQNGLQAWISVGGWSFTDPGPSQKAFSNMASSQGNRAKFISGLMQFMSTYGFDGIDLDWEYPGADDRGGVKEDTANYVLLAQELRAAFGSKYGISMTLPTSYWYLQHFDLPGIQQHIDWFNLMAYDLHGVWDKESKFVGPYVAPHTNITEIDLGMDLLWRSGVTPDRVILGQGLYGRSFTLADPSCNTPNGVCKFTGGANAGPCSNAAGILDKQEIDDIVKKNNLQPTWAHAEGVKWITWDSNQWVSYDDADTFKQKKDFANSRCLGGLMVWAMDQVDQSNSNDLGVNGNVTPDQQSNANQMSGDQLAGITCRSAPCGSKCPKGSSQVTESNAQPGQLSTSEKCPKGKHQPLCCDHGTTVGKCQWRGFRGAGLSCIGGCADGETEVTTNKNNHSKKGDQTCNGGVQSYCCAGFKPAPTKQELAKKAKDTAEETAKSAAEQAALDIAAKAFCRVAVPALLAPLELLEDAIPIFGEIADIAEIAATPAIIKGCVKGIEKAGKAEFKVFGKKKTLSLNEPSKKPTATRPPTSSHETPKTSSDSCNRKGRGLEKRVDCAKDVTRRADPPAGPALRDWSAQHNAAWLPWMRRPKADCNRDEWPPNHFWQGDPGQLIRYNHREDNQGAGSLWRLFCPEHADFRCEPGSERVLPKPPQARSATTECRKELTLKVMSMSFDDGAPLAQQRDLGLSANECYPKELIDDPGFALLNTDPYVRANRANAAGWALPPSAQLISGRTPPNRRRDLSGLDPNEFILEENNSSRRLSQDELTQFADAVELDEHLRLLDEQMQEVEAYVDCVGDDCATSAKLVSKASMTSVSAPSVIAPSIVDAIATTVIMPVNTVKSERIVALARSGPTLPAVPEFTGLARAGI